MSNLHINSNIIAGDVLSRFVQSSALLRLALNLLSRLAMSMCDVHRDCSSILRV